MTKYLLTYGKYVPRRTKFPLYPLLLKLPLQLNFEHISKFMKESFQYMIQCTAEFNVVHALAFSMHIFMAGE